MRTDGRPPSRGGGPPREVRRLGTWLAVGLAVAAGCRPNRRYDLLEAELRTRERELLEARAERDRLRQQAELFGRPAGPPDHPPPPGVAVGPPGPALVLPVRDITLGTGTGGVDDDGRPGDESLMAVVVPRDADGSAVKVPGRLLVAAFDVAPSGLKSPLGRWDVPPDQLRRAWRSGLLGSGYFVPLQWDRLPASGKVRVAVRLVTADGRAYEADTEVAVRPLPAATPAPIPVPVPPAGPARPVPPADVPELPPPAEVPNS